MGEPEDEAEKPPEPPKSEVTEPANAKIADRPREVRIASKGFSDDDSVRETVPAQRLRGRLELEQASVIVDPSIARVEVSEQQRLATERFADRARFLALACFISAGLTGVVVAVSPFGRI